jgi:hypothetical protein
MRNQKQRLECLDSQDKLKKLKELAHRKNVLPTHGKKGI